MAEYSRLIPDYRVEDLQARIEQIASRAKRMKLDPPVLHVLPETELVSMEDGEGKTVRVLHRRVLVIGETPMIEGWEVAAVIEHAPDAPNMIQSADPDLARAYREAEPCCEHCNTTRQRNKTAVLREQDGGTLKQVGSSCVADFTGGHNVERALGLCSLMHELREAMDDDEFFAVRRPPGSVSVRAALAIASRIIHEHGFVSREAAEYQRTAPTSMAVREAIEVPSIRRKSLPTVVDLDVADRTLAWVDTLEDDGAYQGNLRAAVYRPYADDRVVGLLASGIAAFQRKIEKDTSREPTEKQNAHVGAVKDKLEFDADVITVRERDGTYGITQQIVMRDDQGRTLVWWASRPMEIERGDRVRCRGTIKGHDSWDGTAQTMLTRCNITTLERAADRREQAVELVWRSPEAVLAERPELEAELETLFLAQSQRVGRATRMSEALNATEESAPQVEQNPAPAPPQAKQPKKSVTKAQLRLF
jgi:hypothetical protein